jgi:hypothetical protein
MASSNRLAGRLLWGIALTLIASVLVVVVIKVRPILQPQALVLASPDPACDLTTGPCTARFPGGGSATLSVEPKGIPPIEPLHLSVELQGIDAASVQVDFAGVGMDMGYNRRSLTETGPGIYRGQGMLPICVRDRMAWEARVLIGTPAGLLAAPFRFETTGRR